MKEVLGSVAEEYEWHMYTMEVMEDHVYMFIEVPPAYSPAAVVRVLKRISARELFKKFPKVKHEMWSGKIWGASM